MDDPVSCEWYDVGCGLGWLVDELKAIFLNIWLAILNGLAALLEYIPVPDFLQNLSSSQFQLPPSIMYFTGLFHIAEGIAIIVSAYIIRFIIRRLPIVG